MQFYYFETSYNIYERNVCWKNVTMNLDESIKTFAIVNLKLAIG